MIITETNGIVKIPVISDISTGELLHVYRDNYDYVINYSYYNDYFINAQLNASIFAGEWLYSIGNNIGIMSVRTDANDSKNYENSCDIFEYQL